MATRHATPRQKRSHHAPRTPEQKLDALLNAVQRALRKESKAIRAESADDSALADLRSAIHRIETLLARVAAQVGASGGA